MGADTKAIAKAMVASMTDIKAEFAGVSFSFKDIPGTLSKMLPLIMRIIAKIEEYAAQAGGLTGPDKRSVVIHAINEMVDIPFVPESFEDNIIGMAVDGIVAGLNKVFGQNWAPFAEAAAAGAPIDV